MADSVWAGSLQRDVPAEALAPRHSALVRITHWLTTLCFLALLVTGVEILISHPRFYWGETGNIFTAPLFTIHIPASRQTVPTGYGYVLPDQNGWSRYLHFQAAWGLVLTGSVYVLSGLVSGHFRRDLFPRWKDFAGNALVSEIGRHLRLARPSEAGLWTYNVLQRLTYLAVIFILLPLMIWTGLAMSPGVAAGAPGLVIALGGQQSARTIHFFVSVLLVIFVLVHVGMVCRSSFGARMRGMITGRIAAEAERR